MKSIVRSALFCLALALLLPFTALADDGTSADTAVGSQDQIAMTPITETSAELPADQLSEWLAPPEWTTEGASQSFLGCPGPPVLSCQCGPDLGEPGSQACCYCNTCWDGYILALCGLDP